MLLLFLGLFLFAFAVWSVIAVAVYLIRIGVPVMVEVMAYLIRVTVPTVFAFLATGAVVGVRACRKVRIGRGER